MKLKEYAFTFGSGHHDINYKSLGNFYTVIEAENEPTARSIMYERRGIRWSHCYDLKTFKPQIEEHKLVLLPFRDLKPQAGPNK